MDKIQAVVVDPSVLGHFALKEVDRPDPLPNEALVKVAAVSLNLGEIRYAQSQELGSRIGWDLAGTIEQTAADGSGPKQGARVVGFMRTGAWAQLVAVPTQALAELPERVSFEEAATLPVAGLTALYVIEHGKRILGRNVLVTGANGGVGLFACQIGKLYGARVVALIRKEQYRPLVESTGADDVVVSEDGGAACDFGPYRLIAESVGGKVLGNCLSMLSSDGVCVTYGASAEAEATFNIWSFMRTGRASLYGFLLFNEMCIETPSMGLARLVRMVADDWLRTYITVEEPWEKVGQVAQDLWDRKIPGKAVLHVS